MYASVVKQFLLFIYLIFKIACQLLKFLFFCFKAGASQVKWNKFNDTLLATSHEGDIRIWDTRVTI